MKRFLALIVLPLAGCGETEQEAIKRIKDEVKSSGTITDQQAETLSKSRMPNLGSLTSITDKQAESLSEIDYHLGLGGLTSISDEQAESLSRVQTLSLDGLTSITDEQAESLSKVQFLTISESCQELINKYKQP